MLSIVLLVLNIILLLVSLLLFFSTCGVREIIRKELSDLAGEILEIEEFVEAQDFVTSQVIRSNETNIRELHKTQGQYKELIKQLNEALHHVHLALGQVQKEVHKPEEHQLN